MRLITASQVERLLPMDRCIAAMRDAMMQVSEGAAVMPLRQFMPVPGTPGKLGLMPGYIADPACFGVKIVSKYQRERGHPLGSHVGAVMLFDAAEGALLALVEGGSLTAIRTAAASALATDALAQRDARKLLIVGSGEQARRHLHAIPLVRDIELVQVWSRSGTRAQSFAATEAGGVQARIEAVEDLERAVGSADIICTTTSAPEPFLAGHWVRAGTHLNLVGAATAAVAEVDEDCVARARFFVDFREAALAQAGELRRAIASGRVPETHIQAEIGEVLLGKAEGRTDELDITIYKSLGVSAQDLHAAHALYSASLEEGVGIEVEVAR